MKETDAHATDAPVRDIDDLVRFDSVSTGLRMLPTILVAQTAAGLILFPLADGFVPRDKLFAWAALHFGSILLTVIGEMWRRKTPLTPETARGATRFMLGFACLRSVNWTVAALLFFPHFDFGRRAAFLALLCFLAAGSVSTSVAFYRVFVIFMVLALIPVSLIFGFEDDKLSRLVAVGSLFGCGMILQAGRRLSLWLTEASRRKFELERISQDLRRERHEAEDARERAEMAQRESERSREIAERLSDDKTRFLASASHDLRQPMHSLGLFLEAARARNHDEKVDEMLTKVDSSVRSLDALFESLLDISRLDGANVQPKRVRFPLDPMLADIEHRFSGMAAERGLRLRVRPSRRWVLSDPALLQRVISNFVSNALRYTEKGGVLVGVRIEGARARIEVWDTGVGIPSEKHGVIFDEFVQLGNPERDRRKGLGLGLAIVQRLSNLLNHPITVKSRLNRGTLFTISVPAAREIPAAITPPPTVVVAPQPPSIRKLETGLKILLIDDDVGALDATMTALDAMGCDVYPSANIRDAVATLEKMLRDENKPAVIVSDYRLGSDAENGVELIAAIRKRVGEEIPAVLVTGDSGLLVAFARPDQLPHLTQVLTKPATSAQLQRAIETLLIAADSQTSLNR